MCLFNIYNKSSSAFRRAAWRPGAVKPDNGPKHCWLIITLGSTAPCVSVNSEGLFFLFPPPPAAVDITFCKGYLEQIQAVTFRRQNPASPVATNCGSSRVSHSCHRDTRKTKTTKSWPGHAGKWLSALWVTPQMKSKALRHHRDKNNPSTSGWSSSSSACLCALSGGEQGDDRENIWWRHPILLYLQVCFFSQVQKKHKAQCYEANSPTSIAHSEETILCCCEQLSFGINQAAVYFRGECGICIYI